MRKLALLLLWLTLTAPAALANGAIAERKTGGLVFRQSDTVSILREDLAISLNKITVDYLYRSEADAAQTVTIAFPMASIGVNDDPGSLKELLNGSTDGATVENYMNFHVTVDGKEVKAEHFARALVKDKDISEKITKAGLPLHMVVDDANTLLEKLPK